MRRLPFLLCLFMFHCLQGQLPSRTLEAGYLFTNYNAEFLNNSTNNNSQPGRGINLGYAAPVGPKSSFAYKVSWGQINNLGEPFKSYTYGNFARFDIEFRQQLLSKALGKTGLRTRATFGYGFSYIPIHRKEKLKQMSSVAATGILLEYQPKKLPISFGFQTSLNQRLNNDFRTFLQFQPSVIFDI